MDLSNSIITVDEIRHYLMDRTPDDNDMSIDLAFTDEEIQKAMVFAVREFNSIPPLGALSADPTRLPGDTMVFVDGTMMHLYTMLIGKMRRNDFDGQAGGVNTNTVRQRIAHLTNAKMEHAERFRETAALLKMTASLRGIRGPVG